MITVLMYLVHSYLKVERAGTDTNGSRSCQRDAEEGICVIEMESWIELRSRCCWNTIQFEDTEGFSGGE